MAYSPVGQFHGSRSTAVTWSKFTATDLTSNAMSIKNAPRSLQKDASSYGYDPGTQRSQTGPRYSAPHTDSNYIQVHTSSHVDPHTAENVGGKSIIANSLSHGLTGSHDYSSIAGSSQSLSSTAYWGDIKVTLQNGTMAENFFHDSSTNSSLILFSNLISDPSYNESVTMTVNNSTTDPMNSLISLNYSTPMMIVVSVLLLTLAVLTAFGNFLVGLALFKFKPLRTVSNYLIGNLALSDFLLATTILPLSSINEALGHWVFGKFMCYFWLCVDVLYCTASIWNLCIIAFDRFTATLYPVWYREKRSGKQAAIYILLVWLIAIGICIPPLLGWNDITASYSHDNTTLYYQCVLFDNRSYVIYSASGSFYIPFVITTFLYIRIFMVLRQRMKRMRTPRKPLRSTTTTTSNTQQQQCPLIQNEPAILASKASETNTLQVQPVEIELTTTGITDNQGSGNTDSSKSLFGSESTHSDDEDDLNDHTKGDIMPMYMSSDAEAKQLLMQNGVKKHRGSSKKKNSSLQGDEKQTLVIFNPNHNHSPLISSLKSHIGPQDSSDNSDTDKVKIIVTAENCNGKNTTSNEVVKNVNITDMIKKENNNKTNDGKKCKENNNDHHISSHHFNIMNLIKSPRPKRKPSQKKHRRQDREVKATIRMAIIIAFFCGFWIGFFTTYLLRGIIGNALHIPRELDAFFFWLGYSNSAINPILYTIFNEDFRKAFQKLLGCYNKRGRGGGYSRPRCR